MGRRNTRRRTSALTLVPPGDAPAPPPFPLPDDTGNLFVVLLDSAPDAAVVVDASGGMVLVNSQTERLFGYRREDLVGQPVETLVPVRFRNGHVGHRNGFLDESTTRMNSLEGQLTGMRRDGSEFPVDISVSVIETSSGTLAMAFVRDVTARHESEARVRRSEARFRALLDSAPDAAVIADADGVVVLVNGQTEHLFGFSRDELVGQPVEVLLPEQYRRAHVGHRERYLREPTARAMGAGLELFGRRKDGTEFPVDISLSGLETAEGLVSMAFIRDVTSRKETEDALTYQAMHDALTGLPNRALLVDRLDQALQRARRTGSMLGVLFLDVDHFKVVNDGRGHAAGDQLLVALARRLTSVVRPSDTVARFGGDEFVVMCEDLSGEDEAVRLSERVIGCIEEPLELEGLELSVTVSLGVAVAGSEATAESLLRDADTAMYRAKETGRGHVEKFDQVLRSRADHRLEVAGALRHALERDEMSVVYQPVVSLRDGIVVGAEALLRWRHPLWGEVPPARFVGTAEETGQIVPIGSWVIEQACIQAARWHAANPGDPPLWVSVNLSARQMLVPSLPGTVADILERTGVDASMLQLEVTETVVMDDVDYFHEVLSRLRALGIHLSMDDFGTGYSSLRHLREFPLDTLKVDRTFVAGINGPGHDASIVAAVAGMARALGLAVLAEGVETPDQLAEVRRLGCDLAQGFFITPPLPPGPMLALVADAG